MSNIEIITDRLILRHPVMEDAKTITHGKKEVWPELQKWMSWAADGQETLESTKAFIEGPIGRNSLIGFCRHSGSFIIMTGLTPQKEADEYETGYWVAKDFLGRGYATEATCAAISFAFAELQAKTIHICHFAGNEKSRRVIKKLGFSNETLCGNNHLFTMTSSSALPETELSWRGTW